MMAKNLLKIGKTKKIKYFLISFVDLFGVLRSKLVPIEAIDEMQRNGAGFAGFATWLDMTPADTDMFAIPDPDSLIQLPWNKEVVGAVYPGAGSSETLLVILGIVFWIGWHVLTNKSESEKLSRLARKRHGANDHKSNITDW